MKEETVKKWIIKAENDLKIAKDELNTENPATDGICFHAQQAAEKFLKAFLVFHNKPFRKTHDLVELLELCEEIDESFKELSKEEIDKLTDYATDIRYPEEFYMPSIEEAKEAIEIAEKVKEFVLNKLKGKLE
ncbi:MAG: HEPN domain-containing protein [Candidatus Aenigmatarchaeota archaeon]